MALAAPACAFQTVLRVVAGGAVEVEAAAVVEEGRSGVAAVVDAEASVGVGGEEVEPEVEVEVSWREDLSGKALGKRACLLVLWHVNLSRVSIGAC